MNTHNRQFCELIGNDQSKIFDINQLPNSDVTQINYILPEINQQTLDMKMYYRTTQNLQQPYAMNTNMPISISSINRQNAAPAPQKRTREESYWNCLTDNIDMNICNRPIKKQHTMNIKDISLLYRDYITCTTGFNYGFKLSFVDKTISNEKIQEILSAFKIFNVTELVFSDCTNLETLNLDDFHNLFLLNLHSCTNLHGTINLQHLSYIRFINTTNTADDLIISIHQDCPFVRSILEGHFPRKFSINNELIL